MNPQPETQQLSALQVALLRVLWDNGEATVAQVHAELAEERGLAATTIATLLTRLERRGLVTHRNEGRQFVYRALVEEKDVQLSQVRDLADRVFEGNLAELVSHLVAREDIDAGDLERVKAMIDAKTGTPRKGR
jgi:BlaI family transcriptional regulator, penicillinase repressor